jgi:cardiolipin synthase
VGYTGGFGLADYWLGDGLHEDQWRESNVRFEGPAVMQMEAAFASAWAEATGELLTGDIFFPARGFAQLPGGAQAGLLYTSPTTGSTPAERFLALSIAAAHRSLYITNSYFVPDDDFRRGLKRAVRRGVDVRVLTVSAKTDVKTTWYAGRHWYEDLLAAGVRIYEYQPTMIHSKTIVVDGLWSSVGSMNFDNRSLAFNNESNLVVLDRPFGASMDSTFFNDLRYAKEITRPVNITERIEYRVGQWVDRNLPGRRVRDALGEEERRRGLRSIPTQARENLLRSFDGAECC